MKELATEIGTASHRGVTCSLYLLAHVTPLFGQSSRIWIFPLLRLSILFLRLTILLLRLIILLFRLAILFLPLLRLVILPFHLIILLLRLVILLFGLIILLLRLVILLFRLIILLLRLVICLLRQVIHLLLCFSLLLFFSFTSLLPSLLFTPTPPSCYSGNATPILGQKVLLLCILSQFPPELRLDFKFHPPAAAVFIFFHFPGVGIPSDLVLRSLLVRIFSQPASVEIKSGGPMKMGVQ